MKTRIGIRNSVVPAATAGQSWPPSPIMKGMNGGIVWASLSVGSVRKTDGYVDYFVSVVEDITDRKRAEEQLLLTKYSIDHSADYAFWAAPDARLVFVNDAGCNALGYTRDELLNEFWGQETYVTTRTVDTHIANLRSKLERDPRRPQRLITVHGVGYKLVR